MESSKAQPAEPVQPHEITTRPWQVLGTDLFTLDGSDHLIVADYYSKYTLIKSIPKGRKTGADSKTNYQEGKQSKTDFHPAMLSLRVTPIDNHLPSPGELLFNRKIRWSLPTKIQNTQPDRDKLSERLVERQSQQRINFDKGTWHLSPMIPGQVVRARPHLTSLETGTSL
ncbi:hypothetical protein HOLleu_23355 [Holothuria leucospilota]|uniref:Uncharacterized protein n=1 Tax=Holothuria leucospilota TaxID=206669 RepID=A0A9Q1H5K7_HOLLE|nr:hypothetical protein HOLleu_23355 [Holothuria leucospilota]